MPPVWLCGAGMTLEVFLVAGELSGDKLGGALMVGLGALEPEVRFHGVGGPMMQAQGLASLFPMDELSVMGLAEILPKYPALRRRLTETVEAVLEVRPDVLVTIDSPDFGLRVAKAVRARDPSIRTVHYVAPSVWAWRPGRAAKMARFVDHVLALLPFEPPYMEAAGMRCDFVGHPVVSEPVATEADAAAFRAAQDIPAEAAMLLVLPGSRRGEVARLAPIFGEALRHICAGVPGLRLVVPAARPVAEAVVEAVQDWPGAPVVVDGGDAVLKRAAFRAAHGALAASGTVSLELAAAGTPMVIAYDMSPLSRLVISRLLRVGTVTLVNLVTDTRVVPEFIGKACRPEAIARSVVALLEGAPEQEAALALTMERLGAGGEAPGLRAARAVLDGLGRG